MIILFSHALAKFPFGDTSSALSANMWNQMNVKKLGSSKLKLVDFRIESKTEVQRVEFAETNKEPAVTEHCFAKLDNTAVDQLESVDLKHVNELFPDTTDEMSIAKLYRDGPADAFYLIKFWTTLDGSRKMSLHYHETFFWWFPWKTYLKVIMPSRLAKWKFFSSLKRAQTISQIILQFNWQLNYGSWIDLS